MDVEAAGLLGAVVVDTLGDHLPPRSLPRTAGSGMLAWVGGSKQARKPSQHVCAHACLVLHLRSWYGAQLTA